MGGASETARTWVLVLCLAALAAILTPAVVGKSPQQQFIEFVKEHLPSNSDFEVNKTGTFDLESFRKKCDNVIPADFDVEKRLRELEREIEKIEPGVPSDRVFEDTSAIMGYALLKFVC